MISIAPALFVHWTDVCLIYLTVCDPQGPGKCFDGPGIFCH